MYQQQIDTVGELIEALEDYDPQTPVRWAAQPAWPFEYTIGAVVQTPSDADLSDTDVSAQPDDAPVVWLGEGTQVGYLAGAAASALQWRTR